MPRGVWPALAWVALLATPAAAQEEPLGRVETRYRLALEQVSVGEGERLGLLGGHYDLLTPRGPFFLGLGGHGAVAGERGGFFVLGGTVGARLRLGRLELDTGLFVGGGGGASAPQGSGLMLRPHVGAALRLGPVSPRLELAHVRFPSGRISATGLAVGASLEDALVFLRAPERAVALDALSVERGPRSRVGMDVVTYVPWSGARLRSGAPLRRPVGLVGARLDRFVHEDWFIPLEAHGALVGGYAGYMDVLAGVGYSPRLGRSVRPSVVLQVGAGGGGDIDTGGGLLVQPSVGLTATLARGVEGELAFGPLLAPDGRFGAWRIAAQLALTSTGTHEALNAAPGDPAAQLEVDRWRVAAGWKSYVPLAGARTRSAGPMKPWLQLVGAGLDRPLTSWLSLTGRGYSAFGGAIGGYSEGLLGARAELPLGQGARHHLTAHAQAGAAGGGGVDVASGTLAQCTVGWRSRVHPLLSVGVEAGVASALAGTFRAFTAEVGVRWHFDRPVFGA